MDREIKFRGKRIDNGEWVYGTPFFGSDSCKMIYAVALHPDFVDEGNVYYSEGNAVDPATVGQYTGLPDVNGKEIYEGDVIKLTYSRNMLWHRYAQVRFFKQYARFGFLKCRPIDNNEIVTLNLDGGIGFVKLNEYEIIGNCFDSSELEYIYWEEEILPNDNPKLSQKQ